MLANLPHVSAHFELPRQQRKEGQQQEDRVPSSALFLLDSGAGGVEVMLHARAAQELQLHSAPHVRTHTLKVSAVLLKRCAQYPPPVCHALMTEFKRLACNHRYFLPFRGLHDGAPWI
jgi:hypothetical protein